MAVVTIDFALGLLGSKAAAARLALNDVEATFRELPDRPRSKFAADLEEQTEQVHLHLTEARKKLVVAVAIVATGTLAGWVANLVAPIRLTSAQLGGASAAVFAVAGLMRLGWTGQTYSGNSAVERADQQLFFAMCWLGSYLGASAAL